MSDAAPPRELPALWRAALDRWSESIDLASPLPIEEVDGAIAYIDLGTRQTRVNFGRLRAMGVFDHLPCVLAHEVGHHIRYPHTLSESRRMLRFLREIIVDVLFGDIDVSAKALVGRYDWLLNVFFDLLINDELSAELEPSFVAIFRALGSDDWSLSFGFYVGVFEELWNLEACEMVPRAVDDRLATIDPSWRERARTTGEFVRAHPENRPLQLARFLVSIRPFLAEDARTGQDQRDAGEAFERTTLAGSGELDLDAISDLMRGRGDEESARTWLREATHGGVPDAPQPATGGNPLMRAQLQLRGLAPPAQLAIAVYEREAAKARLVLPASLEPGEPVIPGPHEPWEVGDDLDSVDWIGSVTRAGGVPIPGVSTLRRTRFADDPRPGDREMPWIELYIDSSGSMPNPTQSYSHLIEAGFILVHAATSAGGRVRIVQYSSMNQRIAMPEFTRSARPAQRALLEFIGGGTDFPWDELEASIARFRRSAKVRRVVISDRDFFANAASPTPPCDVAAVIGAAAAAGGITALLAVHDTNEALVRMGLEIVPVAGWTGIGDAARALADALFRRVEARL